MALTSRELMFSHYQVNGLQVDLPTEVFSSVSVSQTPDGAMIVHQKGGVQVHLETNGQLYVMVGDDHAGRLCGACGNFDGVHTNDVSQETGMEKWTAKDFSQW